MKIQSIACFVLTFVILHPSDAKQTNPVSEILKIDNFLGKIQQWEVSLKNFQGAQLHISGPFVLSGILCFIASSISSAGGIGGGGLFIPILTIVAGLDLKTASSLSAFMVTGGSVANIMCNLCARNPNCCGKTLIDYDIALLSEPCMLLGVSIGVICNLVFPEWLITILFAIFLAWSTSKTCRSGLGFWKSESEEIRKNGNGDFEKGVTENGGSGAEKGLVFLRKESNKGLKGVEEPLLQGHHKNGKLMFPWLKFGILLLVWFSFFAVYLLRGNKYGESIIPMEPCGAGYWILSSVQIPLAAIFTAWILFRKETHPDQPLAQQGRNLIGDGPSNKLIFPLMALLAGVLGGVFGIGGGMLISPLLLQVGIAPEVTAATCSFMVFFSSTMSALQYLLLGMEHVKTAIVFSIICFVASLIGLLAIQKSVRKYGRASIIVFSVSIVMALSIVLMTSFGAIEVWREYKSGKYMGFKLPC